MAQMKEQNKTPEKELNETEITNLSHAKFKTLVTRMLRELTEYGKNIMGEPWLVWLSGLTAGLPT